MHVKSGASSVNYPTQLIYICQLAPEQRQGDSGTFMDTCQCEGGVQGKSSAQYGK